jgi:Methyltransferase domain
LPLRRFGAENAIGANLSNEWLRRLREKEFLADISVSAVSAENTGLADRSVDFVLWNERYHHFSRPPVEFCELVGKVRKGTIFVEPAEPPGRRAMDELRVLTKRVLRGASSERQMFEPVGNFIYRCQPASNRDPGSASKRVPFGACCPAAHWGSRAPRSDRKSLAERRAQGCLVRPPGQPR